MANDAISQHQRTPEVLGFVRGRHNPEWTDVEAESGRMAGHVSHLQLCESSQKDAATSSDRNNTKP